MVRADRGQDVPAEADVRADLLGCEVEDAAQGDLVAASILGSHSSTPIDLRALSRSTSAVAYRQS